MFSLGAILFAPLVLSSQVFSEESSLTIFEDTNQPEFVEVGGKKATNSSSVQSVSDIPSASSAPVGSPGVYITYKGNSKYYVTPSGKTFLDRRRVGAIYPNLFDVVRGSSITSEDEDRGCNLEKMFLGTIFKRFGFDTRRYLNALATSNCSSLSSAEEQSLCRQFHDTPACSGVTPLVFEAIPLPAGANYLTYQKNGNCSANAEPILRDTFIPKQSKEWAKIESDLSEKKRANYNGELKAKAPLSRIRQEVFAKNAKATQRDVDFAVNDWVYNEGKKLTVQVPDSEIQPVVEKRYSPASALKNLNEFKAESGGSCKGKERVFNNKVYAEAMNIPAHHTLRFADYVDMGNGCICKK